MKRRKANSKVPEREELERKLEALQRDVRQLQLEHDLLKKANELIKKDLGVDLQILSNREKTQLIDALKELYRLRELLAQLRIAPGSYFYHRTHICLADKYAAVRHSLAEIFEENRRCYGYRRLQASLAKRSVIISEKVVQRLMKQEQLVVARPRRRRFGSYLGEISPAPENLINRDFHAEAPNVKWLTDITEFQIPAGKVYLSPIINCFDGMVISWSIGTQPDASLGQYHAGRRHRDRDRRCGTANRPFRSRSPLSLARFLAGLAAGQGWNEGIDPTTGASCL